MAKRPRGFLFSIGPVEPDPRTSGALRFADPSTIEMTRKINTFNEPHSHNGVGDQVGIRSIGRFADSESLWRESNRKRGVEEDGEEG